MVFVFLQAGDLLAPVVVFVVLVIVVPVVLVVPFVVVYNVL